MNLPSEIAKNYINIAKGKTSQIWWKTLILAVTAGAFIALGAVLATAAGADFTGSQASLIKGAVFPLGLMLVVICGAELFTGNCLLIIPTLTRDVKVTSTLKNLGIVYAGNFVGALIVALLVVYSHTNPANVAAACVNTANAKCALSFGDSLLRGILCNLLVCLAVWAAMASKSAAGKILAVYLPVFAFVACGFEHSVANMYYLTAGLLTKVEYSLAGGSLNVGNALLYSLLPSTLGNIIGGALIGVAYWAVFLSKPDNNNLQKM